MPIDLRVLLNVYCRQCIRTVWSGQYSESFSCTNGIRQGAVASPHLFCVYVDELMKELERNGTGCWLGPYFCGSVCYADDVLLLSPSISGLKEMLETCVDYGRDYGMTFNSSKSMCIRFGKRLASHYPTMRIGIDDIAWQPHIKHLGNYLQYDLSEEKDVGVKKRDLFSRVNTMLVILPDAPENVLLPIFQSKCCHFYGTQAWCLRDKYVPAFFTAWNRSVRKILGLHPATHCRFLPVLVGWDPRKRILGSAHNFTEQILRSDDPVLSFIGKLCCSDEKAIMAKNRRCEIEDLKLSETDFCTVNAIRELKDSHVEHWTNAETRTFLDFLSIS